MRIAVGTGQTASNWCTWHTGQLSSPICIIYSCTCKPSMSGEWLVNNARHGLLLSSDMVPVGKLLRLLCSPGGVYVYVGMPAAGDALNETSF
jgi:hypothetical protein